jgi:hypothetical protein
VGKVLKGTTRIEGGHADERQIICTIGISLLTSCDRPWGDWNPRKSDPQPHFCYNGTWRYPAKMSFDGLGGELVLRIVIWNLKGLSLSSEFSRLQRASDAFRILSHDHEADAFALVELGTDAILEQLANNLGHPWMHYSGAIGGAKSEIGLLLNTERLSATTLALSTEPHFSTGEDIKIGRKPAVVFSLNIGKKQRFLLAVVHFKAAGGGSERYIRKSLAAWLRNELEQVLSPARLPVVIVGDFNGEPCEPMFGTEGFRAYRRADVMRRSRDSLKLYNPMWRLLPDSVTVSERRTRNDDQTSTPYGTFLDTIWHSLIDGVLVSGEWLESEGYVLHDDRLEILTDDLWHHIGNQGAHHARPAGVTEELAITDHLPIAVHLEII